MFFRRPLSQAALNSSAVILPSGTFEKSHPTVFLDPLKLLCKVALRPIGHSSLSRLRGPTASSGVR